MRRIALYLGCLILLPMCISAQIFPHEGALLNYRIIGFTFPQCADAKGCTIQVARGAFSREDSFKKNIIVSATATGGRVVSEVPSFGASYTWRVLYNDNGGVGSSEFYHFSTGTVPAADTSAMRLRILHAAEKYKDAYIFLDGNKALYDMSGNPVWYLPAADGRLDASLPVRDLKLSHRSTITFMSGQRDGEQIYEMDYNGHILWKGPNDGQVSGESGEYYHHQFTRLANGHYMVLGSEFMLSSLDTGYKQDTNLLMRPNVKGTADHSYVKVPLVTIIEYDENGKVVWKWASSDYFLSSDVRYRKRPSSGMFEDVHGNGFFFDQQKQYIYVSFRNISRILKIHYPDGKAAGEYGRIYKPGDDIEGETNGNGFYCNQHYCIPAEGDNLFVFNNNSCNRAAGPSIVKLHEPAAPGGELVKVWEYPCKVEAPFENKDFPFFTGGNIAELPGNNLFINMGCGHSRLLIVTEDKKELWSALPEQRSMEGKWQTVPQYRASILFRNDLERLIFGDASAPRGSDDIMITYNTNK